MKQQETYVISVKMGVGLYRHIQISSKQTFQMLHLAILEAFDFNNDHAHAFFLDQPWANDHTAIYVDFMDDAQLFSSKVKLKDKLELGQKFIYIFDFGDEWTFHCKVNKIVEAPLNQFKVIKSVGKAPSQYGGEEEWDGDEDDD